MHAPCLGYTAMAGARLASLVACALALPGGVAAQSPQAPLPIQLPRALVFPNYDNVLLGKDQALEGGAYIARAGDASANFYNPAGLVQSEKSSLNASSTGWVWMRLSSEALNTAATSDKIDNVPGYVGAVIGVPLIDRRNLRLGFSLTRQVSWAPGTLDVTSTGTGVAGLDRVTYSASSSFSTTYYQGAAAWAPPADRSLRLGASLAVAHTSFGSDGTLSGLVSTAGNPGQFLSTLRASGNDWALVLGAGIQWDVTPRLTIGAVVRSPGVSIVRNSLVTYESSVITTTLPAQTSFFNDAAGEFRYRLPFEASAGIAHDFGNAQVEADVRYHDAVPMYDFYSTQVPLQFRTFASGTTTVTTQPMPPFQYAARRVWNASLGGNYKLGRLATLHGGAYTSFSPVANPDTSPLRRADLYGVTSGVDFQFEHFGISIGAGYQWGNAPSAPIDVGGQVLEGGNGVKLQSISILYAISYSF